MTLGDDMKKILLLLTLLGLFTVCVLFNEEIIDFTVKNIIKSNQQTTLLSNNSYASSGNYNFVQITNDFKPKNIQDIMNIYYTILNSGMDQFIFYCPEEYKNCIKDVDDISNDQNLLSNINNFIPVYNGFQNVETEFDTLGKIVVTVHHSYTRTQINEIENKVNSILDKVITPDMNDEKKIKAIHDYIINNTRYDKDRSDNKIKKYSSDTAYGALIEHYAICGGYSDSMKLFLDKFGITNYKISSENHIWNLVKLDGKWYHLDLTWDDPVTNTGADVLEYDYFLITTDELKKLETDQHFFDKTVYTEAN